MISFSSWYWWFAASHFFFLGTKKNLFLHFNWDESKAEHRNSQRLQKPNRRLQKPREKGAFHSIHVELLLQCSRAEPRRLSKKNRLLPDCSFRRHTVLSQLKTFLGNTLTLRCQVHVIAGHLTASIGRLTAATQLGEDASVPGPPLFADFF